MDSLSIHDSSFAKRDEFLYKKWFHYADIGKLSFSFCNFASFFSSTYGILNSSDFKETIFPALDLMIFSVLKGIFVLRKSPLMVLYLGWRAFIGNFWTTEKASLYVYMYVVFFSTIISSEGKVLLLNFSQINVKVWGTGSILFLFLF